MRLMARRAALRRESITSQALKETFQKCDRQTQSQTERSNLKRKMLKAWLFVTTNVELSGDWGTYSYSTTPVQTLRRGAKQRDMTS
jgi:hypothetical protein